MSWSPERRAAQSKRASRWWSSPAGQRAREALRASAAERWAAFAAKYPERARLIEDTRAMINAGTMIPMLCDNECGRTGKPVYDYELGEVVGWRCFECRREYSRGRNNQTAVEGAQLGHQEDRDPPVRGYTGSPVPPSVPAVDSSREEEEK